MYEIDIGNLQDCLNTNSQRGNKNFNTDLTLGEIKKHFDDNKIHNDIQIQVEMHKQGVLNTRYYDIDFNKFNKNYEQLSSVKIVSYCNSYRQGVLCINIGCFTEEQFFKLLEEMDDIIYPDADIYEDAYEEFDVYEEDEMFSMMYND